MPALVAAAIACGTRTGVDDIGPEPAASRPPHETCKSADGVRLCGSVCPPIPAPECPGYGCTPAYDWSAQASTYGVCWSDRADESVRPCGACAYDEVCISRRKGELVCTSRRVCDALADLGGSNLCRYTDLTPYDARPFVLSPEGPCAGSFGTMCGGECGTCPFRFGYCTGRSSTRALALCNHPLTGVDPLPATQKQCGWAWAQFEGGDAPADLVRTYGVCMPMEDCLAVGKVVGAGCYVDGQRVGP